MATTVSSMRGIYRWVAFVALPGGLWTAFEIYWLTIRGNQLLFFSISHTMGPILALVLISFPFGLLWLVQSIGVLLSENYRAKIGVSSIANSVFALTISVHILALAQYREWSTTAARVPICLVGLAFTFVTIYFAWQQLRSAAGMTITASESDAV